MIWLIQPYFLDYCLWFLSLHMIQRIPDYLARFFFNILFFIFYLIFLWAFLLYTFKSRCPCCNSTSYTEVFRYNDSDMYILLGILTVVIQYIIHLLLYSSFADMFNNVRAMPTSLNTDLAFVFSLSSQPDRICAPSSSISAYQSPFSEAWHAFSFHCRYCLRHFQPYAGVMSHVFTTSPHWRFYFTLASCDRLRGGMRMTGCFSRLDVSWEGGHHLTFEPLDVGWRCPRHHFWLGYPHWGLVTGRLWNHYDWITMDADAISRNPEMTAYMARTAVIICLLFLYIYIQAQVADGHIPQSKSHWTKRIGFVMPVLPPFEL